MNIDAIRVSVVVPFFQRKRGLLRRAVSSAFAQIGVAGVDVIVVDDGSPVAASEELDRLPIPENCTLHVHKQENKRVPAARNAGLDRCANSNFAVALLDSDDIWRPQHLAGAVEALALGYDMYFAPVEFERSESNDDDDGLAGFREAIMRWGLTAVDGGVDLMATKEINVAEFFRSPGFIVPSSVVLRTSALNGLRFNERLGLLEDVAFFSDFFRSSRAMICSTKAQLTMGVGVNIWSSSRSDPRRLLDAELDEHVMLCYALDSWGCDESVAGVLRGRKRGNLENFCYEFYSSASLKAQAATVKRCIIQMPYVLPHLVIYPAQRVWARLSGQAYDTGHPK
jgi:hypothetical protein